MKENRKIIWITGGASLVAAVIMALGVKADHALELFSLPFVLAADGLRWLSFHSAAGNIVAVLLYLAISAIPCMVLVRRLRAGKRWVGDALLVLMSISLLVIFYALINPAVLLPFTEQLNAPELLPLCQITVVFLFYSILVAWLVLRLTAGLPEATDKRWKYWIVRIFQLGAIGCIVRIVYFEGFRLFNWAQEAVTAPEEEMLFGMAEQTGDGGLSAVSAVIALIPLLFTAWVFLAAADLAREMNRDAYSPEFLQKSRLLSNAAKVNIYVTVVCMLVNNVLQMLGSGVLNDINIVVQVPLLSLALSVGAVIFTDYVEKNNRLYEDSQSII